MVSTGRGRFFRICVARMYQINLSSMPVLLLSKDCVRIELISSKTGLSGLVVVNYSSRSSPRLHSSDGMFR
jgi:hypothetical protein